MRGILYLNDFRRTGDGNLERSQALEITALQEQLADRKSRVAALGDEFDCQILAGNRTSHNAESIRTSIKALDREIWRVESRLLDLNADWESSNDDNTQWVRSESQAFASWFHKIFR